MSSVAASQSVAGQSVDRGPVAWLVKIARFSWRLLTSPVRLIAAVRRAMTAASATLLLFGIVSTNIIWGYPWIGVFSACISLFVVGFVVNRWSLPRLEADFLLPRSAVAGAPFQATANLTNLGRFPAMELEVAIESARPNRDTEGGDFQTELVDGIVEMILPGQQRRLSATMVCQTRGLHSLPGISVTTWFPFYLFRFTRTVTTTASIAITPRLLDLEQDSIGGGLLDSLGGWTRKLLSGDAMDYTGSREYEFGMPVRRWDFVSWARLGRPIVREYQSPSVRTVALVVDTAIDIDMAANHELASKMLERVLSLAATAIDRIGHPPIQIRLFVTGQDWGPESALGTDRESLLIHLAIARQESCQLASQKIRQLCEHLVRSPLLILTCREQPLGAHPVPPFVSILRVEPDSACQRSRFQDPADAYSLPGVRRA